MLDLNYLSQGTANAKELGCRGDGVTDDFNALYAAIATASTTTGRLYLPPGTYKITGILVIPSNVTIFGVPGFSIIKYDKGVASSTQYMAQLTTSSNVIFDGITFTTTNDANAVGYGIVLSTACTDVTIKNCTFQYMYNTAVRCAPSSTHQRVTFQDNKVQNIWQGNTASGASMGGVQSLRISGHTFENMGVGRTPSSVVIWAIYCSGDDQASGLVITGNRVYNCSGGIKVSDNGGASTPMKAVTIANNTIDRCWNGQSFVLGDISGLAVTGNTIRLNGLGGLLMDGNIQYFSVTGNVFDFDGVSVTGTYGMSFGNGNSSDGSVGNNTIRASSGNYGCQINTCKRVIFTGNQFFECTNGFLITGGSAVSDLSIFGNLFYDSATANSKLISATGNSNLYIADNYLFGAGGVLSWLFDLDTCTNVVAKNNIKVGGDANLGRVTNGTNVIIDGHISDAAVTLFTNTGTNIILRNNQQFGDVALNDKQTGIVAHAGGGQGSAVALNGKICVVSTVATAGDSLLLPTASSTFLIMLVQNNGVNSCNIFPTGSQQIDSLGASAAYSLAPGISREFFSDGTQWWSR